MLGAAGGRGLSGSGVHHLRRKHAAAGAGSEPSWAWPQCSRRRYAAARLVALLVVAAVALEGARGGSGWRSRLVALWHPWTPTPAAASSTGTAPVSDIDEPELALAATYVCCISEWAVSDVGLWLSGPLQLPTHVAAAFTAAGVDGRALAALR
jgi:hypothetical protein